MPLFSPKRKISDTENKLRVLCCLDALGMATQDQLWPFVAQLELMEYIPFCMFLDELKTGGAIAEGSHALEGRLYVTPEGKEQLRLFSSRVVHTDQERIRRAAPAYAAKLDARRLSRAVYERAPEGEYQAACSLHDGEVPTLFLRVNSGDHELVNRMVKGFARYVPQVFSQLYTLPFEVKKGHVPTALTQDEALAQAQPGSPALCAFGGREHAGVIRICGVQACYTVMLLFPDAELAWGWAMAADRMSETLADALTRMVRTQSGENP